MADADINSQQLRKKLHRIVKQYGLNIDDLDMIPTPVVQEALRGFHLGLLPSKLSLTLAGQQETHPMIKGRRKVLG
jgi:ATP/maltotriose-dependent transcriptional regulator MalT